MMIGVVILAMGIVLVLQALGLISGNFWPLFWGILLIMFGLKIVSKKKHHCWHCEWFGHHKDQGHHYVNNDEKQS